MATVGTTRDKLMAAIDDITSLHVYDTWPNAIPQTPAVVIMPSSMSTRQSMGGRRVLTFEVILIGGPATRDPKRVQDILDTYIDESGSSSIIAKLEADVTLGATVSSVEASWRDYAEIQRIDGIDHMTVTFDVTVWP